jgi:LmbE family N-acetylglucosaminyl deacetylase
MTSNINIDTQTGQHGGTICLSVHSDDIWLAIHRLKRFFDRPLTLATVFSVSRFAKVEHWPQADIASIREREDRSYAQRERMSYVGFGLKDEPTRIGRNTDARARIVNDVRNRICSLILESDPDFLLAPFAPHGFRLHIAHQVVFDAAIEAVRRCGRPTLGLFDDVAYWRLPFRAAPIVNGARYVPYRMPLSSDELSSKIALGRSCYESQQTDRYSRALAEPAPNDCVSSEIIRLPDDASIFGLTPFACGSNTAARRPGL